MSLSVVLYGIASQLGTQTAGRWATADVTTTDGSDNLIYTVPSGAGYTYAMASMSICNRAATTATQVNIAVTANSEPVDSEFIDWNASIVPNGVLEHTQLILSPGDKVFVRVGTP